MRREQRVERGDDPAEAVAIERDAARDAHETLRCMAAPERVGEERSEVSEVSGDDRALFVGLGGEVDPVRPSPEARALADRDDIVAALAKLARDFGRKVLVEQ
jgi:hypothetical protein